MVALQWGRYRGSRHVNVVRSNGQINVSIVILYFEGSEDLGLV